MAHRFTFYRAGGVAQVRLDRADDLFALGELDPKLWLALAMPIAGSGIDERTLRALDGDADGRIRQPDIVAAATWLRNRLKTGSALPQRSSRLALADIADTPEGRPLAATARRVLATLGRTGEAIDIVDVNAARSALYAAPANGDGVVTPDQVPEPARALVAHAVAVTGGTADRSGAIGVTGPQLGAWRGAVESAIAWMARAGDPAVRPLGDATESAATAVDAVAERVDDWFVRCRLLAFDGAAAGLGAMDWSAFSQPRLTLDDAALRALPLAPLNTAGWLPLSTGVHPAWAPALAALATDAIGPLSQSTDVLDEGTWNAVRARLSGFRAWRAAAPDAAVLAPGREALVSLLRADAMGPIREALEADEAVRAEVDALDELDRLVHLHRDFAVVADNFAAFGDFYARRRGTFQAGTLVVDRRAVTLCLDAPNAGAVAAAAASANACIVFADVSRDGVSRTIAAVVTSGDIDRLRPGRNGLFWDREGQVWDATLTAVHDNPIGLRQAFWAPYRRIVRFVEDQISARLDAQNVAAVGQLDAAAAKAEAPEIDVGTVAAIGVAVGGLTAAFGALVGAFFGLGAWMPLGILALVLLISGPSVALAAWKIRTRTVAPLLDAVGWAINGDLRVNIAFGEALTQLATLPPGAVMTPDDPFRDRGNGRWWMLLALALLLALGLAWGTGRLNAWLPENLHVPATATEAPEPPPV